MKILLNTNIGFKRRLQPTEEAEFSAVLQKGKEKLGNTGHSILIVPSASIPQDINTGVGNLLDKEGQKFFDFAKLYWGINNVQLLPEGNYRMHEKRCLPYSGSAFDLGVHLINPELLATEEFGKLLSAEDILKITESNKNSIGETQVNFENVLSKNSPTDKVLRKAYDELLKADTQTKKELLTELQKYTSTNNEWLEPKAIFEALCKKYNSNDTRNWNEFDHNFYNTEVVPLNDRLNAIKGIRNCELGKEMGFYEFKQFIAEKHLAKAKEELNKKGIKLSGDMLVGFSYDEVWANPKAFIKDSSLKWGIPAINFDTPEGEKLIRNKANIFAKRYDGIRIDAGWTYISQPVKNSVTNNRTKKEYGSKILNIIENEIQKVKGNNFNSENIMYELITDPENFNLFEGNNINPVAKDRVNIITSYNSNEFWGTTSAYRNRGWKPECYILGATNHDSVPLRTEFADTAKRIEQTEVLSQILKISKEKLNNIQGFIQAKFAEPMRSKHNMFFFTEALNISDRYKDNVNAEKDYRVKITPDYQEKYFKSLEKGEGLNIMDALEKAFISEGLDKKEPDLFKKIVKYRKILQSSENKSNKYYNLGIGVGIGLVASVFYISHLTYKKRAGKTDSK